MSKSKRKRYSVEFKAKIVLDYLGWDLISSDFHAQNLRS